jgi:hypothetical protein
MQKSSAHTTASSISHEQQELSGADCGISLADQLMPTTVESSRFHANGRGFDLITWPFRLDREITFLESPLISTETRSSFINFTGFDLALLGIQTQIPQAMAKEPSSTQLSPGQPFVSFVIVSFIMSRKSFLPEEGNAGADGSGNLLDSTAATKYSDRSAIQVVCKTRNN